MARELTREEVRDNFLEEVRIAVDYWASDAVLAHYTIHERLSGVAHTILAKLDGCSPGLPGFIVAPLPNPEDKQYFIEEDTNWYPENHEAEVSADIGGGLHEHLFNQGSWRPLK